MLTETSPNRQKIGNDADFLTNGHCFNCHDDLRGQTLTFDDRAFCCEGCRTVYQILNENDLCTFYALDDAAGLSQKNRKNSYTYNYLNDPSVSQSFRASMRRLLR